ncbi:MAG: CPBP family intramembrane metalloprotease [Alicyclobacillus sp.]|nr:CPBP family intramembrane metalloprotease [Alicyclobacillus sp.]
MLSTVLLFGPLCILEYLFWLTPVKQIMDKLSRGTAFYVFPVHYWIRILFTLAVVFGFNTTIHAPFAGFWSWVYSLFIALVMCLVRWLGFRIPIIEAVRYASSRRFWIHSAYILLYPSLVEELLFRWLLVSMLLPSVGLWIIVLAPAINILWHVPVWAHSFKDKGVIRWNRVFLVSVQAYVFAVILTGIYVLTKNVIGVVILHAFEDWISVVMQYGKVKEKRQTVGETSTCHG